MSKRLSCIHWCNDSVFGGDQSSWSLTFENLMTRRGGWWLMRKEFLQIYYNCQSRDGKTGPLCWSWYFQNIFLIFALEKSTYKRPSLSLYQSQYIPISRNGRTWQQKCNMYTTSLDVCQSHHAGDLSEDRVLYGIPAAVWSKGMVNLVRKSCPIVLQAHVVRRNVHVVGILLHYLS